MQKQKYAINSKVTVLGNRPSLKAFKNMVGIVISWGHNFYTMDSIYVLYLKKRNIQIYVMEKDIIKIGQQLIFDW